MSLNHTVSAGLHSLYLLKSSYGECGGHRLESRLSELQWNVSEAKPAASVCHRCFMHWWWIDDISRDPRSECDSNLYSALRGSKSNFVSLPLGARIVVIAMITPGWAAVRPDRPIGGVLSPFASLSTASSDFTSKRQISKFINKWAAAGGRLRVSLLQHRQNRLQERHTHATRTSREITDKRRRNWSSSGKHPTRPLLNELWMVTVQYYRDITEASHPPLQTYHWLMIYGAIRFHIDTMSLRHHVECCIN